MSEKPRLLVVDDEQVVGLSCRAIFERQGFAVDTTTSPVDGLEKVRASHYAAILLDIMMPEMNGLEFLERLRTFNATVPVVIITGYSSVTSAAEAMRLHASDYIPKPFTPDEITAAMRRVLAMPDESATAAPKAEGWVPDGGFLFLDHAWMRRGRDGTVRAGALLPREEAKSIVAVRVPAPGVRVYEGLPLGEVLLAGGRHRPILPRHRRDRRGQSRARRRTGARLGRPVRGRLARPRPAELGEGAGLPRPAGRSSSPPTRNGRPPSARRSSGSAAKSRSSPMRPPPWTGSSPSRRRRGRRRRVARRRRSGRRRCPARRRARSACRRRRPERLEAPGGVPDPTGLLLRRGAVADDEWIDVLDGAFRTPLPIPVPTRKGRCPTPSA